MILDINELLTALSQIVLRLKAEWIVKKMPSSFSHCVESLSRCLWMLTYASECSNDNIEEGLRA